MTRCENAFVSIKSVSETVGKSKRVTIFRYVGRLVLVLQFLNLVLIISSINNYLGTSKRGREETYPLALFKEP